MDSPKDTRTLAERLAEEWAPAERASGPPPRQRRVKGRGGKPPRRKEPKHPLADTSGRVYPHRALAWDVWGPGSQPCWACGQRVYWLRQVKGAEIVPCELRVAFADGDEGNVVAGNLRPCCPECAR
jgi:hypothetical protein